MQRYLWLYLHFLQFSFSKAFEFRMDFAFRIVMDLIFYAIQIGFFQILYLHTDVIGTWSMQQTMVFVCGYLWIDAASMTIFMNNSWIFPQLVNRGDLDYYLLRPVSSLFFLSLREFAANSFINLLVATGLLVYSLTQYGDPLPLLKILLFGLLLMNGVFLNYIMQMGFQLTVFWTHSPMGASSIYWKLEKFLERPDAIYTGFVRRFVTVIMPFAVMASFPTRLLFGEAPGPILFHSISITLILWFIYKQVWKYGTKIYGSASS